MGGKQVGPLSSQQLKAMVAKGKLRPDYQIRRGGEGPWVPAGRVKGLFPDAAAPHAAGAKKASPGPGKPAKPAAKTPPTAKPLPAAQAAAAPPTEGVPAMSGGHGKHPKYSLDQFQMDAEVPITTRRSGKAMAMKKSEQKKVTVILLGIIGFGMLVALSLITWAAVTGRLSIGKHETAKSEDVEAEGKPEEAASKPAEKKTAEKDKWKDATKGVTDKKTNIRVTVESAANAAPPKDVDASGAGAVMIVSATVRNTAKSGDDVRFSGWADFKQDVVLKSGEDALDLLDTKVEKTEGDSQAIKPQWSVKVKFYFAAPAKKPASLHLELPPSAFGGEEKIYLNIPSKLIKWTESKPAAKTKAKTKDAKTAAPKKSAKTDADGDSGEADSKTAKEPAEIPKLEVHGPDAQPKLDLPPLPGEK